MRPASKKRRVVTSDDEEELPKAKNTSPKVSLSKKALKGLGDKKTSKPRKAASSKASSPPPTDEDKSVALDTESIAEDVEPGEDELSEAGSEEAAVISKT
jgi:hypothetical protein